MFDDTLSLIYIEFSGWGILLFQGLPLLPCRDKQSLAERRRNKTIFNEGLLEIINLHVLWSTAILYPILKFLNYYRFKELLRLGNCGQTLQVKQLLFLLAVPRG